MHKISIPVSISWEDGSLTRSDGEPIFFPDKCVYCGGASERTNKELRATVRKQVKGKHLVATFVPLLPYCRTHARQSFRNTLIMIFSGSGFLALVIGVGALFLDYRHLLASASCLGGIALVLGLGAGMIAGAVLGRLALSPVFKSLRDQPVDSVFGREGALGFRFSLQRHTAPGGPEHYTLDLAFANEAYAAEFEGLNAAPVAVGEPADGEGQTTT